MYPLPPISVVTVRWTISALDLVLSLFSLLVGEVMSLVSVVFSFLRFVAGVVTPWLGIVQEESLVLLSLLVSEAQLAVLETLGDDFWLPPSPDEDVVCVLAPLCILQEDRSRDLGLWDFMATLLSSVPTLYGIVSSSGSEDLRF